MGTRSLTVVVDHSWDKVAEICVLYRQFDGYPSGHGAELKEFLDDMQIINGIPGNPPKKFANGIPCLAAQLIAHFKKDQAGSFYLHPAGTRDCGSEYVYVISGKFREPLNLQVTKVYGDRVLYDGPVAEFNPGADYSEDEAA